MKLKGWTGTEREREGGGGGALFSAVVSPKQFLNARLWGAGGGGGGEGGSSEALCLTARHATPTGQRKWTQQLARATRVRDNGHSN